VYKVETIRESYMVSSGVPVPHPGHAGEIAHLSLHLLLAVDEYNIPHTFGKRLKLQIGIHTGNVVV